MTTCTPTAIQSGRSRSAAEEIHRFHLHDDFVVLVQHLTARADDTAVWPTARLLGFEHGEAAAQRIARPHRLEPAQAVDPRRAEAVALANHGVDQQAHIS